MTDIEINEKIIKSLGIKKIYYEEWDTEKRHPMFIPSGKPWRTHRIDAKPVPDFLNDFNACLEWIAPRLIRWEAGSSNGNYKYYALIAGSEMDTYPFPFEGLANELPRAFCMVYLKYLEEKDNAGKNC